MSDASSAIPIGPSVRPSVFNVFAAGSAARPVSTVEVARPAHQPRPVTEMLDAGQCRIWLNECHREIDRLRASAGAIDGESPCPHSTAAHGERRETLADPPEKSPSPGDAVYSLAVMPDRRHPEPIEQPPRITVLNHYHVTNLGTLLDVLA